MLSTSHIGSPHIKIPIRTSKPMFELEFIQPFFTHTHAVYDSEQEHSQTGHSPFSTVQDLGGLRCSLRPLKSVS